MKQIFWIVVQLLFVKASADHLWKGPIQVAKKMMDVRADLAYNKQPLTQLVKSTEQSEPKMICGCSCDRLNWCSTWCFDEVNETCYKSNAMLSPLYTTTSNEVYHCYTHQEPDFIVGDNVTGSPTPAFMIMGRFPSNLVQGIYNFNDAMTCTIFSSVSPWILYDMRVPQIIHEIRITTKYYVLDIEMPHGAEIKVSSSAPVGPGNFSNFELFGTLPNQTTILTTYTIKTEKGSRIRYISIQKKSINLAFMIICGVMAL